MNIFITGNQRSGTTWLYQMICAYFKVGFINNFMARWPHDPVGGIKAYQDLYGNIDPQVSFKSAYGNTVNISDPHEFGYFWRRYFDLEKPMSPEKLSNVDWDDLEYILGNTKQMFGGLPMVFKCAGMGFNANSISDNLENSRFLFIHKNPVYVIEETIAARNERPGYSEWYGFQPFTDTEMIEIARMPIESQVVNQVNRINQMMIMGSSTLERTLKLSYEELILHPFNCLDQIQNWLGLSPRCVT